MKNRFAAWGERFEAFSLRERSLIAASIIVVMFLFWDTLLLSPQEIQQKKIVVEMYNTNQQTEAVAEKIKEMSAALRGSQVTHINARVNELQTLLGKLKQQQKDLTIEFIQPHAACRKWTRVNKSGKPGCTAIVSHRRGQQNKK